MNLSDRVRLHRHQAEWSRPMRRELYRRVRLASRESVLEVGCGDGLITREMAEICRGRVMGVDIDPQMVQIAKEAPGRVEFQIADAHSLPFEKKSFDLVTAHWVMLWLEHPQKALKEFHRVLKPDGTLLLACEPDYGGRIVYPREAELKEELIEALVAEGADPMIGRKLGSLFPEAGFSATIGVYPGVWDASVEKATLQNEIEWLELMLKDRLPEPQLSPALSALRESLSQNKLLIYMPVFWAIGRV